MVGDARVEEAKAGTVARDFVDLAGEGAGDDAVAQGGAEGVVFPKGCEREGVGRAIGERVVRGVVAGPQVGVGGVERDGGERFVARAEVATGGAGVLDVAVDIVDDAGGALDGRKIDADEVADLVAEGAEAEAPVGGAGGDVAGEAPGGFGLERAVALDSVTERGVIELKAEFFGAGGAEAAAERDARADGFAELIRGGEAWRGDDADTRIRSGRPVSRIGPRNVTSSLCDW